MQARSCRLKLDTLFFLTMCLFGIAALSSIANAAQSQNIPLDHLYQRDWKYEYNSFVDEILIHNDYVFVAGGGSMLQLSLSNGRKLNEFRIPCESFLSLKGLNNQLFIYYHRTYDDPTSASHAQPSDLSTLAAETAKQVAFQAVNGPAGIIALDLTSNKKLWESRGWSAESKPIIWENRVILGMSPGGVCALGAETGQKLWKSDFYQPNPGSTEMGIDQASVLGSEKENIFKAVSFADGKQVWKTALCEFKSRRLDAASKLAVGKVTYFLLLQLSEDKPVYEPRKIETILCAGKKSTGQLLWQNIYENQKAICPPLLSDEKVIIVMIGVPPNKIDGLYAVSEKDGKQIWNRSMKIDQTVVPAVIGSEIMLVTQENEGNYAISGLDINTGTIKWKHSDGVEKNPSVGLPRRFNNLSFSSRYLVYFDNQHICALKRRD